MTRKSKDSSAGPTGDESQTDTDQDRDMKGVDHTHPDTDDSFTETGVYERGKKDPDDADES